MKSVKTTCVLTVPVLAKVRWVFKEVVTGLLSVTHVFKGFYFMYANFTVTAIAPSERTISVLLAVTRALPPVKK